MASKKNTVVGYILACNKALDCFKSTEDGGSFETSIKTLYNKKQDSINLVKEKVDDGSISLSEQNVLYKVTIEKVCVLKEETQIIEAKE